MSTGKSAIRSAIRARRRAETQARTPAQAAELAAGFAAGALEWLASAAPSRPVREPHDRGRLAGRSVAGYLSGPFEPPTAELLETLHGRGVTVLLPVCRPEHRMDWVPWHPGIELRRSPFAPVDEPVGDAVELEALLAPDGPGMDALLLPATAVDEQGNRLGQGGGYYDRFLAALSAMGRSVPAAALVHTVEVLPAGSFPVEDFDRPLDAVVTEAGWRPFPLSPF